MPKHTVETVKRETDDNVRGPVELLRYSDTGGLTQFGAYVEVLPPGSGSSIKHWHAGEDEMVYMLTGTATLIEGDSETDLNPGDAATFKAGVPAGHCLENRSDAPTSYLVIGTRSSGDVVTYPDDDRILRIDRAARTFDWTTHAGDPASNPYQPKDP